MAIRVSMKRPDLTEVSKRVGKQWIKTMRQFITQRKSLDFSGAKKNADATIEIKGFDHRMDHTGMFRARAHKMKADANGLIIYLNRSVHPGPAIDPDSIMGNSRKRPTATYDEIGAYNQKGHADENKKSANHIHFGVTTKDAEWGLKLIEDELWEFIDGNLNISGDIKMSL